MREKERLTGQLRRAVEGEAWHGPSVMEILEDVDAAAAAAHPLPDAHSIWELLLHMTAWSMAVRWRLDGESVELSGVYDWPPGGDASEAAWTKAQLAFRAMQTSLLEKIGSMSEAELAATTPGQSYSNEFMLDGIIQHHLYHAGQMALLKKSK
jgi:uncharacterized damage-inducible protein DinB